MPLLMYKIFFRISAERAYIKLFLILRAESKSIILFSLFFMYLTPFNGAIYNPIFISFIVVIYALALSNEKLISLMLAIISGFN